MTKAERKYEVQFNFTGRSKEDLLEGVYTTEAGKRLIKAELGLLPDVENSGGDLRYKTNDPEVALKLLKLVFTISAGGWIVIDPSEGQHPTECLYHLPHRGHN